MIEESREVVVMDESSKSITEGTEQKEPDFPLLRQRPSHSVSHSMDSLLSRHSQSKSLSMMTPIKASSLHSNPLPRKSTSRIRTPSFIASRISIVGFGNTPDSPPVIYDFPDDVVAMFTVGTPPIVSSQNMEDNVCLKRVIYVLQTYKEWITEMQDKSGTNAVLKTALKTMYEMIHELPEYSSTAFLNDFNHLLIHYEARWNEITDLAKKQIDGTASNDTLLSSLELRRHFRDRMNDDEALRKELYFDDTSNLDIVCQQILDKVYCHLVHSFDIGIIVDSTSESMNSMNTKKVNPVTALNGNHAMNQLVDGDEDEENESGSDDEDDQKDPNRSDQNQMIQITQSSDDNIFRNEHLQNLRTEMKAQRTAFQSLCKSAKKRDDVDTLKNHKFLYLTQPRYESDSTFQTDEASMDKMCNFGITWYYWEYYRICTDIPDAWSDGKTFGDLFVQSRYHTLKLELLNNKCYALTLSQFNELQETAKMYKSCNVIKGMKANKSKEQIFGIKRGSTFTLSHIMVILLYCNYHRFRIKFLETYRPLNSGIANNGDEEGVEMEKLEDIKQRHSEFANMGRLLRESVSCFSEQRPFKEMTFYVAVQPHFVFNEISLQFRNPMSVSSEYNVISNYCNEGLVLELKCGARNKREHLPFFHCKILSDFHESEYLFIGGSGNLILSDIIEHQQIDIVFDYRPYFEIMDAMNQFISGMMVSSKKKNLIKLMVDLMKTEISGSVQMENDEMKSEEVVDDGNKNGNKNSNGLIPCFITRLFHVYCLCVSECKINLNVIGDGILESLRSLLVNGSDNALRWDSVFTIFPNLNKIQLVDDCGNGNWNVTTVLSESYAMNTLTVLKDIGGHHPGFERMQIFHPDESVMNAESFVATFQAKYEQIGWILSFVKQKKRETTQGDEPRVYYISVVTFARK